MFSAAINTFNYQDTNYPRLSNKATSIALRPILIRLYNKVFAGVTHKSYITNSIEVAQFLAEKGAVESNKADSRLGAVSVAITLEADGCIKDDLALLRKTPKNSCGTQVTLKLSEIDPSHGVRHTLNPIIRYKNSYYMAETIYG